MGRQYPHGMPSVVLGLRMLRGVSDLTVHDHDDLQAAGSDGFAAGEELLNLRRARHARLEYHDQGHRLGAWRLGVFRLAVGGLLALLVFLVLWDLNGIVQID